MTTSIARIERQQARLEHQIEALESNKIEAIRNQRWQCHAKSCGKKSKLSTVILVQTHWYTSPHGCSGGDYWNSGERNLICPKCHVRHRMIEKDPQPDNYYDFSYEKRREIDAKRRIVMEHKYRIDGHLDLSKIFDNIIDDYDDVFYEMRRDRRDARQDRRPRLSAAEISQLYGLSPHTFTRFINA